MAAETSVKLLLASFSVVILEERCDREAGEKQENYHQIVVQAVHFLFYVQCKAGKAR